MSSVVVVAVAIVCLLFWGFVILVVLFVYFEKSPYVFLYWLYQFSQSTVCKVSLISAFSFVFVVIFHNENHFSNLVRWHLKVI